MRGVERRVPAPVLLACFALVGCRGQTDGESPPETHPVTGRVVFANGAPFPGGLVEFRSVEQPQFTTTGRIAEDGTFALQTMHEGRKYDGAVTGPHRVTVIPNVADQTVESAEPVVLPETLQVEPGTNADVVVTVPGP